MSQQLITKEQISFTEEQVKLIKSQIAPKATDAELKLFLYQAKRTGLDPLTRQIYCIHRKSGQDEKMTIQTSIDGFRVIAERSGDYGGQDEPIYEEENGQIVKCSINVYRFRGDIRYKAAVGVAYFNEYAVLKDEWVNNQKTGRKVLGDMWGKMPHAMIAKVAEALAIRKAYPQDLSGLYTGDEMEQMDGAQPEGQTLTPELSAFEQHIRTPVSNVEEIEMLLQSCENVEQMKVLFMTNKKLVEAHKTLKQQFSEAKDKLTQSQAAN